MLLDLHLNSAKLSGQFVPIKITEISQVRSAQDPKCPVIEETNR